jgi:hypothetical protein
MLKTLGESVSYLLTTTKISQNLRRILVYRVQRQSEVLRRLETLERELKYPVILLPTRRELPNIELVVGTVVNRNAIPAPSFLAHHIVHLLKRLCVRVAERNWVTS